MTKHHQILMSFKKLLSVMVIITVMMGTAYADIPNCEVGNTSQGYWLRVSSGYQKECPFPGPPAIDSSWPKFFSDGSYSWGSGVPYLIEGRYKISSRLGGIGYSGSIPPSGPACITGYAEAFTAVACAINQSHYPDPQPANIHVTFTASGNLCTWLVVDNYSHTSTYSYVRYFESGFLLDEWQCNPAQTFKLDNNKGPPPCSLQ